MELNYVFDGTVNMTNKITITKNIKQKINNKKRQKTNKKIQNYKIENRDKGMRREEVHGVKSEEPHQLTNTLVTR